MAALTELYYFSSRLKLTATEEATADVESQRPEQQQGAEAAGAATRRTRGLAGWVSERLEVLRLLLRRLLHLETSRRRCRERTRWRASALIRREKVEVYRAARAAANAVAVVISLNFSTETSR
jgi:hypothetical protein